ncbi:MAG: HAMP domain-containing sensor histidine kinase [Actinomycetota bacterium]
MTDNIKKTEISKKEEKEKNSSGLSGGGLNSLEFVSHELKGILGSTILCVYSIRDGFLGMLNFKQRASIETTIRNLRRLESTIKDFLDIAKIEESELKVKLTSVNIYEDVLKEVEDTFLSEIYEKRMLLQNNVPNDLVINTDRLLMITIFNNLISNAIKYGVTGGHIEIVCELNPKNIKFSVYNDGIPINASDKESLFKKFSRIETENNKKIKGTGLGLFIVKNIVESLGGKIWMESKENGNIFIFEIERG